MISLKFRSSKTVSSVLFSVVGLLGIVATTILVLQNQDIREKAATNTLQNDFVNIQIVSSDRHSIYLTDVDGKVTGFDPEWKSVKEEIPGSSYLVQTNELGYSGELVTVLGMTDGMSTLSITVPTPKGKYILNVAPLGDLTNSPFIVYAMLGSGDVSMTQPGKVATKKDLYKYELVVTSGKVEIFEI